MYRSLLIILLASVTFFTNAQTKATAKKGAKAGGAKPAEKASEKKYEMKTYYLVFLKKGPNRTQDSATAAGIQTGHMAHLNKMADAGKMDLAGPLMDDGDLRGICVYNVTTQKEAEELVAQDPAIISGRLIAEIHPWYSAKGASLK